LKVGSETYDGDENQAGQKQCEEKAVFFMVYAAKYTAIQPSSPGPFS